MGWKNFAIKGSKFSKTCVRHLQRKKNVELLKKEWKNSWRKGSKVVESFQNNFLRAKMTQLRNNFCSGNSARVGNPVVGRSCNASVNASL